MGWKRKTRTYFCERNSRQELTTMSEKCDEAVLVDTLKIDRVDVAWVLWLTIG